MGGKLAKVVGGSWYKWLGRACTSGRGQLVRDELVQGLGASWFKCWGQAGSSVRGELVRVLGASWLKC